MAKRVAAWVLAILLLASAQAQDAYVVDLRDVVALVDGDGTALVEGVEAAYEIERGALYAAGSEGAYGLYDGTGRRLNDGTYERLEAVEDAILFRQGGKVGAMDRSGAVTVPTAWDRLVYAGSDRFLAISGGLYDDQPDEIVAVTPGGEGQPTGSLTADGLRAFHDGRMAFMLSDGLYGYVDARGRQAIPPQWRYAGDFSNGVAVVSDGDGLGLIDTEGKLVVEPLYDWMRRGDGFIAALTADHRLDVFAPDGSGVRFSVEQIADAEICGGYVIAGDGQSTRLYDVTGKAVFEAPAGTLFFPGLDGQVIVADEEGECLIDPDGRAASSRYPRLLPLNGCRYVFMTFDGSNDDGARCGLMDSRGNALLPAEYLEILPAGDDRLVLASDEAVLFADLDGNVLRTWPVSETAVPSSEAAA